MPSLLRTVLSVLRAPANEVGFALRSCLRWSRGTVEPPHEDKCGSFDFLAPAERAAAEQRATGLQRTFDLAALRRRSTRPTWLSCLARLEVMQRLGAGLVPPVGPDGRLRALDVGCGDFHYATALQRWLAHHASASERPVVLRGIELDGHGVYRDGRSRSDHARAHAALASGGRSDVQFQVADFARRSWPEQDVVTMFFPFLSAYACLQWGAPLSRLAPRRLLRRAVAALRPDGWLLVVNQTGAEFDRLQVLLAQEPVERLGMASGASTLVPWAERTVGQVASLWRRTQAVRPASSSG